MAMQKVFAWPSQGFTGWKEVVKKQHKFCIPELKRSTFANIALYKQISGRGVKTLKNTDSPGKEGFY